MSGNTTRYRSWGRLTPATASAVRAETADVMRELPAGTVLPFGNGRSYGDVCLNSTGVLLDARPLAHVEHFDATRGIVRCGGGVLLSDILKRAVPHGWFLPVTPGTRFVTVAGAIANDVHGKNHHHAGTFGRHVLELELARSDGTRLTCSPTQNPEWFRATVGGMGLTGLIAGCTLQLVAVPGPAMRVRNVRFARLSEFFRLSEELDTEYEYTVAWVDCLARGDALGRGWYFAGRHAEGELPGRRPGSSRLSVPVEPPFSLVNRLSLSLFNRLYFHRRLAETVTTGYEPFFYPLDSIRHWNRLYGPRGFFQFQCVVPPRDGEAVVRELLVQTARLREGSFLAVLKIFGDVASPGLLSFPRPGPTLALDFPNRGDRTRRLLARLEQITVEAEGALYPAKDACMSPETFARGFPDWPELERMRDPAISSDFWRRVTGAGA